MVTAFAVFLVVHGAIHLLGFVKAFGLSGLSGLSEEISPGLGLLWLAGAALFLAAAIALFLWPRAWWAIATAALAVSVVAIVPSWADAKFGLLPNAVVLTAVVFGFLVQGPFSLRAEYERDLKRHLTNSRPAELITAADLDHLPAPVKRHLLIAGVVGTPRVRNFRATMHGRIRGGPTDPWFAIASEQYNLLGDAVRLFYLTGSKLAVPVHGYHRYIDSSATMRVRAAGFVPVVDAFGPQLTRSETVTLFNDLCLLAPGALTSSKITWASVDARTVTARFTNAGETVQADLIFNEAGDLTNFVSDDRYQLSSDGRRFTQRRWSTPIQAYRSFGGVRVASEGEGHWHDAGGEYAYIQLVIDDVEYNVPPD